MPTRRRFLSVLAVLLALPLAPLAARANSPAQASETPGSETQAMAFISHLGQEAIDSLTGRPMSNHQRQDRFKQILDQNFDVPAIGRFVLGRHWRIASDAQRQEYLKLFERLIVDTYASRFSEYSGEKLTVDSARNENDAMIVSSRILRPNGPAVHIDWRLKPEGTGFKIVDVVVEGVSMGITQRSEFAAIIQRGGGNVQALIDALRQRVGQG